jgi:hypothetical protein
MKWSTMTSRLGLMITATILWVTSAARADHFSVSLEISNGKEKQSATTQTDPPKEQKLIRRPVLEGSSDSHFTATWKLTATGTETLKDVLVHFYVVRIDRAGQAPPPLEPRDVVIESAMTMDFEPKGAAGATLKFQAPQAGTYLVRIETQGGPEKKTHEHFAAIDLVVK